MRTTEARLSLKSIRKRAPGAEHVVAGPSDTALEVEFPSDVSKRICLFQKNKDSFVVGTGPRESIDVLSADLDTEVKRVQWLANARVAAILGSC